MKIPFKIYYPGGNRTALVFKSLPKRYHAKISRAIMEQYSEIEQVGFVSNLKNNPHLDMMGGEFCGNASRCLVYELSSKKNKSLNFSVSGYKGKICGSIQNGQIGITLPGDFLLNLRRQVLGYEVHFQGISFLVMTNRNPEVNPKTFLKRFSVNRPAAGLVNMTKKGSAYTILPMIFVPSTKTLVEETACTSGSIAAALVLNRLGRGRSFTIFQPSGKHFKVRLLFRKNKLEFVKLSGSLVLEGNGFISY